MNQLERISKLHPKIITNFLETGESSAIPVNIQRYILQISWAAEISQYERSIAAAARTLQMRIFSIHKIKMHEGDCRRRIADALNFFSVDDNVTQDIWDRRTADNIAELGQMAAAKGDVKTSITAEKEANFFRTRAASSVSQGNKTINFFITPNLTDSDLGFTRKDRKQIARKHNDGFYTDLINKLPTEKDEKKKLFFDADITDYEEIE